MKKILFAVFLTLVCICASAQSSKGIGSYFSVATTGSVDPLRGSDYPTQLYDFTADVGVKMGAFHVFVPVGIATRHWETLGIRSFSMNGLLGLGAGYAFSLGDGPQKIELNASVAPTVTKDTYNYLASRVSLNYCTCAADQRIWPSMGIVAQYLSPFGDSQKGNFLLGLSIGFSLR